MGQKPIQDDLVQIVTEGELEKSFGPLVDKALTSLCRYINGVAGDAVIAESDSMVRATLIALLLSCEELRNAKG